jgi:FdrA protein
VRGLNQKLRSLLKEGPRVVNIGVEQFAQDLAAQGVKVVQMDWRPPQAGSDLLSKLRKLKRQ